MSTLFQNVLTASFHGSIVIAVVLLLRLVLRSTPRKFICLLWLLAGLRLLMPFEIQSHFSLQPEPVSIQRMDAVPPAQNPMPVISAKAPGAAPSETAPQTFPTEAPASPQPAAADTAPAAPAAQPPDWKELVPWIWLGVTSCFLIYTAIAYFRVKQLVQEAVQIRGLPGCWECDRLETAFILGFLRPQIYIPMGLSRSVQKHILAHERAHLEKGDHWFKMIGFLTLSLHWFNPLVWVAYTLLCKDIELACDERVIQFMSPQERKDYSVALLNCSTHRAHYAACPVAFGEVSVKQRILSVMHYRKPGFWISLAGVAAIAFVALCLVTSPAEAPEDPEIHHVSGDPPSTYTAPDSSFALGLDTPNDIVDAVRTGMDQLLARESLYIERHRYLERNGGVISDAHTQFRRYQENIAEFSPAGIEDGTVSNYAVVDGQGYTRYLGQMVISESGFQNARDYDPVGWLRAFHPDNWMLTSVEQTRVVREDAVSLPIQWQEDSFPHTQHFGKLVVFFREDGSIYELQRSHSDAENEENYYLEVATIQQEDAAQTDAAIRQAVENAVTADEAAILQVRQEQVTEIPSNKTEYDRDFALGAGQMGWKFMDGEWFFKFGAENVTATGLTLVPEYNDASGNMTLTSGTVTASDTYFIEKLEDGAWVEVPRLGDAFQSIPQKTFRQMHYPNITTADHQKITWTENYGSLGAGFYRIGNSYTYEGPEGKTDVQICYAKFRLYDPNQDALLAQAKAAIDQFLTKDSYHIVSSTWPRAGEISANYRKEETIWKSGKDYLSVSAYRPLNDSAPHRWPSGALWRDGVYWGLQWQSGNPPHAAVTDCWRSVDGYMDDSNFAMWSWDYQWFDSKVELVYREGQEIHILETYDFDTQYACTEIVVTLAQDGQLQSLRTAYLPTRSCSESEKIVTAEASSVPDSPAAIAKTIADVDVSQPLVFDYAKDLQMLKNGSYKTVTTAESTVPLSFTLVQEGFQNTVGQSIANSETAIALADRESRLDKLMEFENGYCQSRTYYDAGSSIWKVELFWWQEDSRYQAVYLDASGKLLGIVTCE